jgi:hypothetical protein
MERRPYHKPEIEEEMTISPELKGRGVFYDAHDILKEKGELADFVVKDFHLDILFSEKGAVELFSKQEEEHETMKKYFPPDMIAESVYLVPNRLEPLFEKAKLNTDNIYPYHKFWQIQANRRLAGRYGLDERHKNQEDKKFNQMLARLGKEIENLKEKKFTGAIIQERINGTTFADILSNPNLKNHPNYPLLQHSVQALVQGLREFHQNEPRAAYTWHSLESDNVMVETDKNNEITGRVVIIDTNFSQRPDKVYQKSVIKKPEEKILQPLEEKFELNQ